MSVEVVSVIDKDDQYCRDNAHNLDSCQLVNRKLALFRVWDKTLPLQRR